MDAILIRAVCIVRQVLCLPCPCLIVAGGANAGSSLHPSAVGVSMAAAAEDSSSSHGLVVS